MTLLLLAKDLEVKYGARAVLSSVCLGVRAGELVALIGPNGAGKTTLLKTLSGLLRPHSGVVDRKPRLRVAYLAQSETLPVDWLVREVVELGRLPYLGFWRTLSAVDQAAVRTALVRTATLSFADRRLGALSGGERQRVALARALAQEPELLLLDEPTTHLDLRHQADLFAALRREAARGISTVAVMHDLTLASHADRCILLCGGTVHADGPPEAVLSADSLSQAYQTPLDVVEARDGRRVVIVPGSVRVDLGSH